LLSHPFLEKNSKFIEQRLSPLAAELQVTAKNINIDSRHLSWMTRLGNMNVFVTCNLRLETTLQK
jgi:hypothetical protein